MDVHGQGEVPHEAADDGELLVVLFTEHCSCWAQDLKELENDGAYSFEMTGPGSPAEVPGKQIFGDPDGVVGSIEFRGGGREHDIYAKATAQSEIFLEGGWVVCEVAGAVELQGVQEYGYYHGSVCSGYFPGGTDKGCMAFMQSSHGGNED